ncbi:MAG: Cof-type HAD-IIB family hydrolase [Bacilli bacterium]|nr:Cof-type HAD-IIB family hydrolase [Bacilli bacterium]
MNKDIKIIFVDIDFTLYDHYKNEFNKECIEAINQAQKNGVKIIISTARPYDTMRELGTLDVIHPDGYIVNDGAIAVVDNHVVFEHYFPTDLVRRVVKVMKRRKTTCEIATFKDRYLLAKPTVGAKNVFRAFKNSIPPTIEYDGQNVCTIMIFGKSRGDETLQKQLGEDIHIFRFCPDAADLTYKTKIEKGDTVKKVLEYLNISSDNAMAIGDDYVDISMFKIVKYGVAMGNAKEEVKKNATHIAKHISDGGFNQLFKDLDII